VPDAVTSSARIDDRVARERRRLRLRGLVQGVGFRPFVFRLAARYRLGGFVRNDGDGLSVEVEGATQDLDAFEQAIRGEAPPHARIEGLERATLPARQEHDFRVLASEAGEVATAIGPDTAVCDACLRELFDPAGRRWRHALITCAHCGPRFTITRALPYDRAQTSMARFPMCEACASEYGDPADRRFHAESIACPRCGPVLQWDADLGSHEDSGSRASPSAFARARWARSPCHEGSSPRRDPDALASAVARLRAGGIVAIKGLGGYHLACDARDATVVARLRERKHRDEKPFAVMALNAASLEALAHLGPAERALLQAPERPIVLLGKRPGCDAALAGIAPGLAWLGAMLPYTPLHYLLFHEWLGRPEGTGWIAAPCPVLLVMTSANPQGEPLVRDDGEARARLDGIADALLSHDREIVVRCDDSVTRVTATGVAQFLRRARGSVPRAIALSRSTPSVLAMGAWFKNTVCLTRGRDAFVSQHVGDLDTAAARMFLEETVAHLRGILAVTPAAIAHDLHPDFHSSRLGARLADELGIPRVAVQHHHAHVAAVLAEHRIDEPAVGLALDGVGLGEDGGAWGGELLWVSGARVERVGHLRPLALPGGDKAAREPWRMAASALHALDRAGEIGERFAGDRAATSVAAMLERGIRCPPTSSLGRCFDAAAGLLGLQLRCSFEGQAAMALEGLASTTPLPERTEGLWRIDARGVLDLRALFAELADIGAHGGAQQGALARGAALFHAAVADALADWAGAAARARMSPRVVAAGGCMLNALLSRRLREGLARQGVALLEAQAVPPNDGGVALGQAWVAQRSLFGGG